MTGDHLGPRSLGLEIPGFDLKMHRQPLADTYNSPRTPNVCAPWPEPPCPRHLNTFEFFPFLPRSVRQRIWILCLPGPRVIEIRYANKLHEFRSPIPVILHVSREARSIALETYETAAASPMNDDLDSALGHRYHTYVNFSIDTFCPVISFRSFITGEWKSFLRTLPNCTRIERFGLPKRCFQFPSGACIPLLLNYINLREVVVIADPCIDHHPTRGRQKEEGWRLGPGEVLPTMASFGQSENKEILEDYSVEFMDKFRHAWNNVHDWDLVFVYKGVCWGGQCWEGKKDAETRDTRSKKSSAVVRKIIGILWRGVARVMMLVTNA